MHFSNSYLNSTVVKNEWRIIVQFFEHFIFQCCFGGKEKSDGIDLIRRNEGYSYSPPLRIERMSITPKALAPMVLPPEVRVR